MFDETTPPTNLPIGPGTPMTPAHEPEDMFAKVEPVPSPGLQPSSPAERGENIAPPAPAEIKPPLIASKKVIIVVGAVLGILVIAGIAYGVLKFVRQAALPPAPVQENATSEVEAVAPQQASIEEVPGLPPSLPPPSEVAPLEEAGVASSPPAASVDTDGDGLVDTEEAKIGTDVASADSDTDGLLDGEEVNTYGTDPLNKDTDGDTYLDGQEVKSGYDPKGPGKLFSVPAQP